MHTLYAHSGIFIQCASASDCTGLKVSWEALQASSLICITDSLCDMDFMILFVSCQSWWCGA